MLEVILLIIIYILIYVNWNKKSDLSRIILNI